METMNFFDHWVKLLVIIVLLVAGVWVIYLKEKKAKKLSIKRLLSFLVVLISVSLCFVSYGYNRILFSLGVLTAFYFSTELFYFLPKENFSNEENQTPK